MEISRSPALSNPPLSQTQTRFPRLICLLYTISFLEPCYHEQFPIAGIYLFCDTGGFAHLAGMLLQTLGMLVCMGYVPETLGMTKEKFLARLQILVATR